MCYHLLTLDDSLKTMARRKRLSRGASRRSFRRGAKRINRRNMASVMRGGFRI